MTVSVLDIPTNAYRGGTLHAFIYDVLSRAPLKEAVDLPKVTDKFGEECKIESIRASINKVAQHCGFLIATRLDKNTGVLTVIRHK